MAQNPRGRADYLQLGDWNASCSMCGRKRKASQMVRNWQGLYRCPEHDDQRQPQDFVRAVPDIMSVPWAQLEEDLYITFTPTLPASVFPSPLVLTSQAIDLQVEQGPDILFTEAGIDLTTETGFLGEASVILPSWIIPVSFLWSWLSGGVGILIDSPTSPTTFFTTIGAANSGIAQCVITDSLGGQGLVTLSVTG